MAGLAVGEALRAVEVALVVFLGLLICPPLLILAVLVVVPPLVIALILGLIAAVFYAPYLLVHHFRGAHRRHAHAREAPPPPRRPSRSSTCCRTGSSPTRGSSARASDRRGGPRRLRHLRPRGAGALPQPTTTVELFFDLVYVFAVTQLSHRILDDLTVAGVAATAFLLLVVWWAWIDTTWMANWFDPASSAVRGVLTGVMLGSLLMAAALPEAFGEHGLLFAGSYVALQVGRNAAAAWLLDATPPAPRRVRAAGRLERRVRRAVARRRDASRATSGWSLWIPALALELAAPAAGYWLPGRGRASTTDYDIEGGHFAERCQLFIIIAFGESIVVTGATASDAGLTTTVVLCLIVAFVETAALWWLYFGATAEQARATMSTHDDPGRLARDAYTYLHLPIVAGIIAAAVGNDLLIAHPDDALHGVGLAMMLGGPALFLTGESLFVWRMTGTPNLTRLAVAALLVLLVPVGGSVSALVLAVIVAGLLSALAAWELQRSKSAREDAVASPPECAVV